MLTMEVINNGQSYTLNANSMEKLNAKIMLIWRWKFWYIDKLTVNI